MISNASIASSTVRSGNRKMWNGKKRLALHKFRSVRPSQMAVISRKIVEKPHDQETKRLLDAIQANRSSLDKTNDRIKALNAEIHSLQKQAAAEESQAKNKR